MAITEERTQEFIAENPELSSGIPNGPKFPKLFEDLPGKLAESYANGRGKMPAGVLKDGIFGDREQQRLIDLQDKTAALDRPLRKSLRIGATALMWTMRAGNPLLGGIAGMDTLQDHWSTDGRIEAGVIDAKIVPDIHGHASANISAGSAWYDASNGPIGIRFRLNEIDENAPQNVKEGVQNGTLTPKELELQAKDKIQHLIDIAGFKAALGFLGGAALAAITTEALIDTNLYRYLLARGRKDSSISKELKRYAAAAAIMPIGVAAYAGIVTETTQHDFAFYKLRYEGLASSVYRLILPTTSNFDKYKENSVQLTTWLDNLAKISKNVGALPGQQDGLIPMLVTGDAHSRPCVFHREALLVDTFHPVFGVRGGDYFEWGQTWEPEAFSTPACPDDNPSLVTIPEFDLFGNHDPQSFPSQLSQYPNNYVGNQLGTIHVKADGPSGPMEFSITTAPDPRFTPDAASRPTYSVEDEMVKHQGEAIGQQALIDNPDFIAAHDPAAIDAAREVMGHETNKIFFDFHTHAFAVIKDANNQIIGVNPGSEGGSGLRTLEQSSDEERSTSEMAIVYLDPNTKKIVWVLQLAVHNDGSISGTPHYSGEAVDSNKSEVQDTLFASQP